METIWLKIVKERLRRHCESPVTKYLEKLNNTTNFLKTNREFAGENTSVNVPIVYQYKFQNIKREKRIFNLKNSLKVPLSMILLNKQNNILNCTKTSTNFVFNKFDTWPGFKEFEELYKNHSKGKLLANTSL